MPKVSWQRYYELSLTLSERLKPDLRREHSKIAIDQHPPIEGLLLMGAGLILGLDPLLNEKGSLIRNDLELFVPSIETFADFQNEYFKDIEGSIPQIQWDGMIPESLFKSLENRRFHFSTSGSTGEAKTITKSIEGLLAEVVQLKELYQLKDQALLVSLVRPFHIYGFLHSFLLPLFSNAGVIYWPVQSLLASRDNGFPLNPDLMITVPAHWSLIKKIWSETRTMRVVSSGAVFGKERREELREERKAFDHYHEILGSTETGGIGHRLLEDETPFFTLFQGVEFKSHSEGSEIFSPFLYPEVSVLSTDRLEIHDPLLRRFVHLGRADRIFKYSGLRHSLSEVEDILKALSECSQVLACFDEDESIAQGGILSAWLEGDSSKLDLKALQSQYLARASCPYPRRLQVLEAFPRDAQGKVSIRMLKELAP